MIDIKVRDADDAQDNTVKLFNVNNGAVVRTIKHAAPPPATAATA